ncbi:MAG: hypothetical protein R2800_04660 [Flavipsychrobacter sp.]
MKKNYYQNRLERFKNIAKRLVDKHSAELYQVYSYNVESKVVDDMYQDHFANLGKELDSEAHDFIKVYNVQQESLASEIWNTCSRYLQQFAQRNQPA